MQLPDYILLMLKVLKCHYDAAHENAHEKKLTASNGKLFQNRPLNYKFFTVPVFLTARFLSCFFVCLFYIYLSEPDLLKAFS